MKLLFISSALLAFVPASLAQAISETTTEPTPSTFHGTLFSTPTSSIKLILPPNLIPSKATSTSSASNSIVVRSAFPDVAVETTQVNNPSTFHGTLFSTPTSSIKLILPPNLIPSKATSTSFASNSIAVRSAVSDGSVESTPATPPATLPVSPVDTTLVVTAPLTTITPSSVCRLPSAIDKRLIASEVSTNSTRTSGRVATGRSVEWVPSTTSTTSTTRLATSTPISTTSSLSSPTPTPSTLETSFIVTSLESTTSAAIGYTTLSTSITTSTSTALDPCADVVLKPRGRFMRRN